MSFVVEHRSHYSKPVLGTGIYQDYYTKKLVLGRGPAEVFEKIFSPSVTNAVSNVVAKLPEVYNTAKNLLNENPSELNNKLSSSVTSIIDEINNKNTKKGQGLSKHSKMVLNNILKTGSGVQFLN